MTESSKKLWVCLATALVVLGGRIAAAATIDVVNVSQFQSALALAVTNREDDVINVALGTYSLTSTLTYIAPTNENKSLTIQCVGGGAILDAGTIVSGILRGMYIITSGTVANVTLYGLTFVNAHIQAGEGSGAGLFARVLRGSLTLQDCVFSGNKAEQFLGSPLDCAGAWVRVDNTPGAVTVRDCVFSNNYATGSGGGLFMTVAGSTTGRIYNCLFATNSAASQGGGAYVNVVGASVFVENNTFTGNWTGNGVTGGGGLDLRVFLDSDSATVRNNIIWGNSSNSGLGTDLYAEDDPDGNGTGSLISLFNNDYGDFDIQDGDHLTSGSNTTNNPLLTSDWHLRSGSPCIDTGTNLTWMTGSSDVDGQARIFNGRADMGIDEATVGGASLAATNGTTINWDAVNDAKYQLQYCTNLVSPVWQNAGSVVTAATRRVATTDTNAIDAVRTYRLQWTGP